jgi:hypothetical protein
VTYRILVGSFNNSVASGLPNCGNYQLDITSGAACANPISCGGPITDDTLMPDTDARPDEFPNLLLKNSNGVIPVAVKSSPEFSATQIDPTTVRLSFMADDSVQVAPYVGSGPSSGISEVGSSTALIVNFRTSDVVAQLGLDKYEPGMAFDIWVSGMTTDGQVFRGTDTLKINGAAETDVLVNVTSNVTNVWVSSDKKDLSADAGGFATFAQHFNGSEGSVTYTAPQTAPNGQAFSHWLVDGVAQPAGVRAISVDVSGNHSLEARYNTQSFGLPGGGTLPGGPATPKQGGAQGNPGPFKAAGGN